MYDVIVIGGGPAGMIAAGRAGQLGQHVLLLEKNKEVGLKLSITGKDRCNVTHFSENRNELIDAYGKNGKFLYSSLAGFSNADVMNFFEDRGVKMKVERGDRVFPVSDKASDIRQALIGFLAKGDVEVMTASTVNGIVMSDEDLDGEKRIAQIILTSGERIKAKKYIITTGGLSYPSTGSTGDGYEWARDLGHNIVNPRPALSPLLLTDWFIEDLEGLSLRNVEVSVYLEESLASKSKSKKAQAIPGKVGKMAAKFGEAIFTHRGISGPVILDLSKKIGELLEIYKNDKALDSEGRIVLKLDLKPALDFVKLDKRIQRDFKEGQNKQFKNILDKLLPKKFIPIIMKKSKIDLNKHVNLITKEERKRLVMLIKEFTLHIDRLVGFDKAIITTGGVDLKEVDSTTMQSRIVDNLYFAGEVLDLDGPTGGYNLQVAWSTGYAAGNKK